VGLLVECAEASGDYQVIGFRLERVMPVVGWEMVAETSNLAATLSDDPPSATTPYLYAVRARILNLLKIPPDETDGELSPTVCASEVDGVLPNEACSPPPYVPPGGGIPWNPDDWDDQSTDCGHGP
jgi:hypothetical protein